MKDPPAVSVIVPSYNYASFVGEAIESVLAQDFESMELVVVDDGSTDDTGEVVRRFSREDPRVRYFRQANGGLPAARNAGFAFSRGRYVLFLDADDLLLEGALNHLYSKTAENPGAAGIISDLVIADEIDKTRGRYSHLCRWDESSLRKNITRTSVVPVLSLFLKRDFLETGGLFDCRYPRCEDWDMALRLLSGFEVIVSRRACGIYRLHGRSMCRGADPSRLVDEYTRVLRYARRKKFRLPGSPAAMPLLSIARTYLDAKSEEKAIRFADAAGREAPLYYEPHFVKGLAFGSIGERKKAMAELEIALEAEHSHPADAQHILYHLSFLHMEEGNLGIARDLFSRIKPKETKNRKYRTEIEALDGFIDYRMGKKGRGKKKLERLSRSGKAPAGLKRALKIELAHLYRLEGNWASAERNLRRIPAVGDWSDPLVIKAFEMLVDTLLHESRLEIALRWCRRGLERVDKVPPEWADLFVALASAFGIAGKPAKSLLLLKTVMDREEFDPSTRKGIRLEAAVAALKRKRYQEALSFLDSIEGKGERHLVHFYKGNVHRETGHPEKAAGCYRKVWNSRKADAALKGKAAFHMGRICLEKGMQAAAERHLKRCLSLLPDHGEALKLLEIVIR